MPSRAEIRLMEVCGTHTMAIARAGLKSLLPAGVELVSGNLEDVAEFPWFESLEITFLSS